jgi:hypothetical protein
VVRLLVPDPFPDGVCLDRARQPTNAAQVLDCTVESAKDLFPARPTTPPRQLTYLRSAETFRSKIINWTCSIYSAFYWVEFPGRLIAAY